VDTVVHEGGTDGHSIMPVLIFYSIYFKPIVMDLYRPA